MSARTFTYPAGSPWSVSWTGIGTAASMATVYRSVGTRVERHPLTPEGSPLVGASEELVEQLVDAGLLVELDVPRPDLTQRI